MGCCASSAASVQVLKHDKQAEIDRSPEEKRYGPTLVGHEASIQALFRKIDVDSDGYLVAGELKNVVAAYTEEKFDEKQFFDWFDVHGAGGQPDSKLDLKEFGWYLADICEGFEEPARAMPVVVQKFEQIVAGTNTTPSPEDIRYGPTVRGHNDSIKALFQKIDADGDGYLVAGELKDIVSKYTEEKFNEKQFFQWFDVHGAGGQPDSKLDLKEFGWYLADICEGFDQPCEAMPAVISKFEQIAVERNRSKQSLREPLETCLER